jgi:hypothetical protein
MTTVSQRAFSSGEIAPELLSKINFEAYLTGLRTCRNTVVRRHGGLQNRTGTEFIAELATSTPIKLVDFVVGAVRYVLIFTDGLVHFSRDGALVYETAKNITGASKASPGVITAVAHGLSVGDWVRAQNIGGMTQLNGRDFMVGTVPSVDTVTLKYMDGTAVNTTGFTTYTSGGTLKRAYGIATPWAAVTDETAFLQEMTYAQTGNIMYFAHRKFKPQKLTRTNDTSWAFADLSLLPVTENLVLYGSVANDGAPGSNGDQWVLTSVDPDTGEESLWFSAAADPDPGLIVGTSSDGYQSFIDNGIAADPTVLPPFSTYPDSNDSTLFDPEFPWGAGAGSYPQATGFYQQRLGFGGSEDEPETAWWSAIGLFEGFEVPRTLRVDDAFELTLAGRQSCEIRHFMDLDRLLTFTNESEQTLDQPQSTFTFETVSVNGQTYNGCNYRRPLYVDKSVVYMQEQGPIVRDLFYTFESSGYRGDELSVLSAHLIEGYEFTDWAYQKSPNSVVWAVRDDGAVIAMTYVQSQGVVAWHRHDFQDGEAKAVCAIKGDIETDVYFVVDREIDGATRKFFEKLSRRNVSADTRCDLTFLDCFSTYDGRNTGSTTMRLTQGTAWQATDLHTLTASVAMFAAGDVGNQIQIDIPDTETQLRFRITEYVSTTVVKGYPHKTTPVSLQGVATTSWAEAVDEITGLWHLEGQAVTVFGDGGVIANPNNTKYSEIVVENGAIDLPRPMAVVHVGLPYISDVETLDIDTVQVQGLVAEQKIVGEVKMQLDKTLGLYAGAKPPTGDDLIEGLYELKYRQFESPEELTELFSGSTKIVIKSEWNSNGRVFIRQLDPVPFSILSIHPDGLFFPGGA